MTVVPFKHDFDNPKAFLLDIAADDNIRAVVVVTFDKDGLASFSHCNIKRKEMAFAACVLSHNAIEAELGDD